MPGLIEKKTKAATWASFGIGVGITALTTAQSDAELLGTMPLWLQAVITTFVPPLVTFIAGYKAPHTPRPELADSPEVRYPRG